MDASLTQSPAVMSNDGGCGDVSSLSVMVPSKPWALSCGPSQDWLTQCGQTAWGVCCTWC